MELLSKSWESKCGWELAFLCECTSCPKRDRIPQATSICLLRKFQVKERSLQWQLTSGRASPLDLGTMQHSHARHFHPAKGTTEGSQDCLAELPLSTFAKRPVPPNPTACSYGDIYQIYPRANTTTVLLQWGNAARKSVEKSGRSSQRPQPLW